SAPPPRSLRIATCSCSCAAQSRSSSNASGSDNASGGISSCSSFMVLPFFRQTMQRSIRSRPGLQQAWAASRPMSRQAHSCACKPLSPAHQIHQRSSCLLHGVDTCWNPARGIASRRRRDAGTALHGATPCLHPACRTPPPCPAGNPIGGNRLATDASRHSPVASPRPHFTELRSAPCYPGLPRSKEPAMRRTATTLPLLALALAACTGGDRVDPAVSTPGAEESARTNALEAGAALLQGNGPLGKMDMYVVGFHPMKDHPLHQMEAHHFCRQVNEGFAQCALFDGNSAEANLTGIEYIISETVYE